MKHKNIVMLEGRISDDFKYTRTQEGKVFATFTMVIRSFDKEFSDNSEKRTDVSIRIHVFDYKLVQYLKKVKAHNGCLVSVFGRMNSYRKETRRGDFYTQNNVVVRDIHLVKTMADEEEDENDM